MYIITSGMNPHDDYICHYGHKGMRWGEHIFGIRHINKLRKKIGKHVTSAKNNKMTDNTSQLLQQQQQLQLQQQMMHNQLVQQQLLQMHMQAHQTAMNMHMGSQMQQQMTALGSHYVAMGMM